MEFFELMAAMRAKAPVMTKIIQPSFTAVIVGTVEGIAYRRNRDDEICTQVEIKERKTNSVTVVSSDAVEPLWERAEAHG